MKHTLPPITVTDHALLRWFERAQGVDVEFFRRHLAGKCERAVRLGAVRLILPEGSFYFRGSSVVTFLSPDMGRLTGENR